MSKPGTDLDNAAASSSPHPSAPPPPPPPHPAPPRPGAVGGAVRREEAEVEKEEAGADERKQGNWVLQMLRVQPRWVEEADAESAGGQEAEVADGVSGDDRCVSCGGRGESEEEGCAVGEDEDGKESDGEVFDRASFSRLLRKVSLSEAKEYSKMSYLCNIAYMIPRIQPKCLRRYNLWFVTSSVQEKARTNPDEKQGQSTEKGESSDKKSEDVKNVVPGSKEEKGSGLGINPFDAYQVMSTAASYLHSQAMGITPSVPGVMTRMIQPSWPL